MVAVGRGDLAVSEVRAFLGSRSPLPARLTAPASGLFLECVFYPGDERDAPLRPAVGG